MNLKFYALLAFLFFFRLNSLAVKDIRNNNELALGDLFLTKAQFQSLSPADQISYLSGILFLTTTQDQIYSLTTYEDYENPPQSAGQKQQTGNQTAYAASKFGVYSELLENKAHAILPALLVRLALTGPVRAQLVRVGMSLLAGARRVAQILEARALTASLAKSRVQIINMYRTRASLLNAEAKLLTKNDPAKLATVRSKLGATNQQLHAVSENFLINGGTKKQLEAALVEAQKSGWRKAGEIGATGGALFLGTELLNVAIKPQSPAEKPGEATGKIEIKDGNSQQAPATSTKEKSAVDPEFCLYGLYPSKMNSKKACIVPQAAQNQSCKKNEFLCPNLELALGDVVTEKNFCVTKKPNDTLPVRCMNKILSALNQLGRNTDSREMTWSPEKTLEMYTQLIQSKFELTEKSYFAKIKPESKTKIGDYCSDKATSENRNQKAECAAIETLLTAIDKTKAAELIFKRAPSADPTTAGVTPESTR